MCPSNNINKKVKVIQYGSQNAPKVAALPIALVVLALTAILPKNAFVKSIAAGTNVVLLTLQRSAYQVYKALGNGIAKKAFGLLK